MNDERQMSESAAIKIFIAAQSAIVRAGLESLVKSDSRFEIAGSGAIDFSSRFQPAFESQAEVILLDVASETEFNSLIKFLGESEDGEELPVFVLLLATELQYRRFLRKALQIRLTRGILPREVSTEEITAALAAAAENLFVASQEIIESLLSVSNEQEFFETDNNPANNLLPNLPTGETLTPREKEILEMLAEGTSNKLIAYRLNISEHTVKFHVSSIFAKLAVTTRTEAVTESLRRGLILL